MLTDIVCRIKGIYLIEARGRFPERILNIASANGIYVRNVTKSSNALYFSVSGRGWRTLSSLVPENISVSVKDRYGFPIFFAKYKKRLALFSLPILFAVSFSVYYSFIWRVEISGGSASLQRDVLKTLDTLGIRRGAYKRKINPDEIKRRTLLSHGDLSWLWVNIDGTCADVRIVPRKKAPDTIKISEPSDVISTENGVVTSIQTFCGTPLIKEGETVEKGQLLITGTFRSENENIPTYHHHACGSVYASVWREKALRIPKQIVKKTRTGNKKSVFGIKFKKNNIKFSLNSGISYAEYDKIENELKLPALNIRFFRTDYYETNGHFADNDISKITDEHISQMCSELEKSGATDISATCDDVDCATSIIVKIQVKCNMRIDKEIPIDKGDTDGKNN